MRGWTKTIYPFRHSGHASNALVAAAGYDQRLIVNLPEVLSESENLVRQFTPIVKNCELTCERNEWFMRSPVGQAISTGAYIPIGSTHSSNGRASSMADPRKFSCTTTTDGD